MDNTSEAEDWPTEWTREEMLAQHVSLIERENQLLQEELMRYRQNLAKLIDMHAAVMVERDKLASELKRLAAQLSRQNIDGSEAWKQIDSLKRVLHQRESVMRQFEIPEQYFGGPN